ncbi:N-acetylglucosamine-6-phosphate deacetylase [Vibrio mangrovi]|uniref:N-acetylglucosamine-6-phosphate deacetylase n=1 Tax=Vibrio mangrovi TaxID=474394 RepID=A0A1Y6IPK1_9VIBR|nr:N-acetylglucosamine-6-phosphate deacetylase [Vibrio mangrovi]MDW6003632.1 N-acetylglucosamine-6-phosphate deacetylase [Vibrio mangrovi]SMR99576.1 N-acetylglucosamine-6-phosphate deacetylase [Vibrio mangrovi]
MFALCHSEILTGDEKLVGTAVVISENKIHALVPQSELPEDIPQIDLHGHILSPGFIDLQLNGCGGVMFNSTPTVETLEHMHLTNLQTGTTSFLPTLISDSDHVIHQAIEATKDYMSQHQHQVLGMHLEGPYTNPLRKGIHPLEQLRQPDNDMINWLAEQAPWLKKITLAPEVNQTEHLRQLHKAGIIVSVGHTAATYEQASRAFAQGATFATHLYNAMTSIENGRSPGVVGAVFDHDNVHAGIIADGYHVHWANVRTAKKIMGNRLCLVTDATAAATPPSDMTEFDFCGTQVFIRDGQCVDEHGTLGGSALTMNEGIRLLIEQAEIPQEEAFRMATLYPAQAIGMDHQLGAIRPGLIANLTILDPAYQVINTLVNGVWTKDMY